MLQPDLKRDFFVSFINTEKEDKLILLWNHNPLFLMQLIAFAI
jgi:hypothetical protein